jgi:hypothetical protein
MAKMQDITKRPEKPVNLNENKGTEMPFEQPSQFEVEKQMEIARPLEMPTAPEAAKAGPEATPTPTLAAPLTPAVKSPALEKIEDILEEDLEEIYFKMPPEKQAEFNKEGEKTATKIALIMQGVNIKVKKILELIRNWLKIIPGINKFFLEQEAKIKTDKIIDLKDKQNQNKL